MRARLWLLLPTVCLYAGDLALTLAGQPEAYWVGDYSTAEEYNPVAYPLLVRHPALFLAGAIVWLAVFATVVLCWHHPLAAWLAIGVALGSALGGSTWFARHGTMGWLLAVVYLSAAAFLSRACWRRAIASA